MDNFDDQDNFNGPDNVDIQDDFGCFVVNLQVMSKDLDISDISLDGKLSLKMNSCMDSVDLSIG